MSQALTFPDYDRSILGIPNALLKHYGAEYAHAPLPLLDERLQRRYRNVVLMVFDGMGSDMLTHNLPPDAFLRKHKAADISSVYPCTTTAALTTLESGLSPIEHGWLGWNCYFKEIWRVVDLFTGHISGVSEGVPAADRHLPRQLMPYESLFDKIKRAGDSPDAVCRVDPFSEYAAHSVHEICAEVQALCAEPGRHFIYTYHLQPDHDMHDYGCYDERVRFLMAGIDAQLHALCASLDGDTLVIITADHGQRTISMKCVEDYPRIAECLALPPSMEPRCLSLFLRGEYKDTFTERFTQAFGDEFMLFTKAEALEKGLFGPGKPHPKALDFIGDYIAAAVGGTTLCVRDNKGGFNDFKSSHAGLDAREMTVPLILAGGL